MGETQFDDLMGLRPEVFDEAIIEFQELLEIEVPSDQIIPLLSEMFDSASAYYVDIQTRRSFDMSM